MSEALLLDRLKHELGPKLVASHQVAPSPGLSTGWGELDRFLLWHGLPKSALTLMVRTSGGGATTLWMQTVARLTAQGLWAAWINDHESQLTPWSLRQRKVDLSKLLWVSRPADEKQILWALQELMSLDLFEIIGCDLGELQLKEHQLLKLKKIAMRHKTAVVLFSSNPRVRASATYALILQFQKEQILILRAQHRPTPHLLDRKDLYADTLPQLAAGRRALGR